MKVLLLFLCVILFIAFTTATTVEDSSDGIENKELSRKRRMIQQACPIIQFSRAQMPNVWANMNNAINAMGKPATLNRVANKAQKGQNRRDSGCPKLTQATGPTAVTGLNCDEYPFASSSQGGVGAVIKMVPATENSIQGGKLSGFYRSKTAPIGPGGCYTVQLVP